MKIETTVDGTSNPRCGSGGNSEYDKKLRSTLNVSIIEDCGGHDKVISHSNGLSRSTAG
eukprot:m.28090 g.28090  ORF g.28090 m.28090 type:complete len:59 (-) comp7971_c0_seq1:1384-1560(-)